MVSQNNYLTPEGMEKLEQRLRYLTHVRRAEVAERLRMATEEGGELVENAEYEDAKNEQAFVEGEIQRLEQILASAEVIEDAADSDVVVLGSRVTIVEKGTKDAEDYQIVGPVEANPHEGRLSFESPLGKALLGAKVGDKVKVKAPDGEIIFKVKSIY